MTVSPADGTRVGEVTRAGNPKCLTRWAALPAIAVLLVLSACGDRNDEGAKSALNTADQALAEKVSLSLSDLPTGWVVQSTGVNRSGWRCNLSFADLTETGKAASPVYLSPRNPNLGRVEARSNVSVYRTSAEARTAFERFMSKRFVSCTVDSALRRFRILGIDATNRGHERLTVPRIGDRSGSYIMFFAFADPRRAGESVEPVFVLQGRAVIDVSFVSVYLGGPAPRWSMLIRLARALAMRAAPAG